MVDLFIPGWDLEDDELGKKVYVSPCERYKLIVQEREMGERTEITIRDRDIDNE